MIGEFDLIRRFSLNLKHPAGLLIGPGDDCAVVRVSGRPLLITTDMLIEGVHFRREWMTPGEIGAKAIRVNLSDIAAMGGTPRFALVSVGLPRSFTVRDADRLFQGMKQAAERAKVSIIGGDTNAASRLVVNVVLTGEACGPRVLMRKGARVGDFIYVTGTLGDSALGLQSLRKRVRRGYTFFVQRHTLPPNRVPLGKKLARIPAVHSLIDLSDGLVGDLGHILEESSVGAEVWVDRVPLSRGFLKAARRLGSDPVRLKIAGGEDYELLFTASPGARIPDKIDGIPVTKIGKILPQGESLRLIDPRGRRLSRQFSGFRHF